MKVGSYELGDELGRGGMGAVYKARGPDGADVALKVLLDASPHAVGRFLREVELLKELGRAEGFVPLLDTGTSPRGPWLVMPLYRGGTLRTRLAHGALDLDDAVELVRALARALAKAHRRGIVHRDLKPENVLFDADGRPLVADLGLGKHFAPGLGAVDDAPPVVQSLSRTGALIGSIGYMAPEQIANAKTVGPPADVFALGAILYECAVGRSPFQADDPYVVNARTVSGLYDPLRRARPDAPRWLEQVVARALATEPGARYPGAAELAGALEQGAKGDGAAPAWRLPAAIVAGLAVVLGVAFVAGPRPAPPPPPPAPVAIDAAPPPRPPGRDPRAEARALAERGAAVARADAAKARADFDAALTLDPTCRAALEGRATLREAEKDLAGATDDVSAALAFEPRDVELLLRRAGLRLLRGDGDNALADYGRAIDADPRCVRALVGRGTIHAAVRDFDRALPDLDRALSITPDDCRARETRANVRLANGDAAGFEADLDAVIAVEPRNAEALQARGAARVQRGDTKRGLEDLDRAVELDPKNVRARGVRGAARSNLGDLDGGLADLDEAVRLVPDDASVVLNRAITRRKKGLDARADLERVAELDPSGPFGKEARAILAADGARR